MNLELPLDAGDGRPGLWEAEASLRDGKGTPTGYAALDALLPEAGWARAGLTELLVPRDGIGALQLLLPTLARLSLQRRWIAWVAPPYMPYGPALTTAGVDLSRLLMVRPKPGQDGIKTIETCLAAGTCSAVLAWPMAVDSSTLRRWQRAALCGGSMGFLFRPQAHAVRPSPVGLRLQVETGTDGVELSLRAGNGAERAGPLRLSLETLLGVAPRSRWC